MLSTDGVLRIPTPAVFEPLLKPSRYKGLHGGRGGAKSWFFAEFLMKLVPAKGLFFLSPLRR